MITTAGNSRFFSLVSRCFHPAPLDLTEKLSWYSLLGLPLLYASAFFIPRLTPTGAYFLPSRDFLRLIVLPTAVVVAAGSVIAYAASAARKWCTPRIVTFAAILVLTPLTLIAMKGILNAAGYDWQDRLPIGRNVVTALRDFKVAVFVSVLVVVWAFRGVLRELIRILSSLGFAFASLALIRLFAIFWNDTPQLPPDRGASAASQLKSASDTKNTSMNGIGVHSKRVVWVIFDEADFNRTFQTHRTADLALPNFDQLARISVFATNANSPASGTLYSVPALLTGVPLGGTGVQIDSPGSLSLTDLDARPMRFGESGSIFGALAASGRSASILGFFHPYCKLFKLARCDSFAWPEIGHLDDALWANVPDFIAAKLRRGDYWESITEDSLALLPQYLARDDALTFVHLNFPHPPAAYAEKMLNLRASPDPLTEYAHNLKFADKTLGAILRELRRQSSRHEVLLVVSSDHWLRNMWFQAGVPDTSQPIPFIVWRVGETQQIVVSEPVSTVHTAAMILQYLDGKLSTQADIAEWWVKQPVYQTYVVPST